MAAERVCRFPRITAPGRHRAAVGAVPTVPDTPTRRDRRDSPPRVFVVLSGVHTVTVPSPCTRPWWRAAGRVALIARLPVLTGPLATGSIGPVDVVDPRARNVFELAVAFELRPGAWEQLADEGPAHEQVELAVRQFAAWIESIADGQARHVQTGWTNRSRRATDVWPSSERPTESASNAGGSTAASKTGRLYLVR